MDGLKRYERLWNEWDLRVRAGESPEAMLQDMPDETLMELLAAATSERRFERNLLLTTAQNRLARQKRAILRSERETADAVADAEESVKRASDATQDVRDRLVDLGEEDAARHAAEEADAAVDAVTRAGDAVRNHRQEVTRRLLAHTRDPEILQGDEAA